MITLAADRARATLHPDAGAAIATLEAEVAGRWQPLLSAPPPDDVPFALRSGLFVMVPFANRAAGNLLQAGEAAFRLRPNTAQPLALHGTGWERPWQVLDRAAHAVTLGLAVDAASYPFAFDARLNVALSDRDLRLDCAVTNRDTRPIPAGIGFHPYFPRSRSTRLCFGARQFWLEGPDHLPTSAITIPPELDFAAGAALPECWRNNVYSGWSGRATITQPEFGYDQTLTASDSLRDLMLYTPVDAPYWALEPQSHTTGVTRTAGVPRGASPLWLLRPGEQAEASLTLAWQLIQPG